MTNDSLIIKAARYAKFVHDGQMRKWSNDGVVEPYIYHCGRVAMRVTLLSDNVTANMIAAAWLHDTIEDCDLDEGTLATLFNPTVAHLVFELTNPSKVRLDLNRQQRKQMDREHLMDVSDEAKVIKLIDRIDNLNTAQNAPADFKKIYIKESKLLANAIGSVHSTLYRELWDVIKRLS